MGQGAQSPLPHYHQRYNKLAKQTEFESPPKGHVGLLVYDSVTNKWYAVLGDSDGHIQLEVVSVTLPTGAAKESKQLANDHDVNVSNQISGFATALKQLANDHDVNVSNMPTGFATALKQLPDGHNVNVSNQISGFATALKQLADGHNVSVSNMISGFATEAKQLADGHNVTVRPAASERLIGFKDTVVDRKNNENLSTGSNNLDHTPVPEGEIHVISSITQIYVGDAPSNQAIRAVIDSVDIPLKIREGAVDPDNFSWSGTLILGPTDFIRHTVNGATATNNLYGDLVGYTMAAP